MITAWAGAAVVVIIVVITRAMSGSAESPKQVAVAEPVAPPPIETPSPPEPPPPAPPPPEPPKSPATAPIKPPPPVETPAATPHATPKAPKRVARPMVVDYDNASHGVAATPTPPSQPEDTSLADARAAYATGNQHLFAGDANGAIRQYQQALTIYPGYIAGYRGLGLAYDQLGDKSRALQALRMYVGSAPHAKDVALIKKRIARLSAK